jgi:predicted permease
VIRPGIRRLFRLAIWRRDVVTDDVNQEIRTHLELRAEQLIRDGLSPDEARAEAWRRFGRPEHAPQQVQRAANHRDRTMRIREWMGATWQDARYALRGLRRERAFAAFVIATLGLGIGANAAMFGVVDRLLLRGPEHVRDASRVVRLYYTANGRSGVPRTLSGFAYVTYAGIRDATHSFDGLAAETVPGDAKLGVGPDAETIRAEYASAGFFPLLGVQARIGRFFNASEDGTAGADHVVVLGDEFWRREFAGDRSALGRTVTIDAEQYTVIGVAPRGFTGTGLAPVDVWLPISVRGAHTTANWATSYCCYWLEIIGRLNANVAQAQAGADVTTAYQHTYTGPGRAQIQSPLTVAPIRYGSTGAEPVENKIFRWLVGVAVVVLLIACANAINLLLARAVRRRREVAIRLALGAGRARLIRLLLTEGLILASAAGVASLAVAYAMGRMMRDVVFRDVEWPSSPLDLRVLGLSAAIALTVGVLIGLVPALRASRASVTAALKSDARDGATGRSMLRSTLTVAQAAFSVVLLVGAGLFMRSLWRIHTLDLGVQPDRVISVGLGWPKVPLGKWDSASASQRVASRLELERVQSLPGVEHASLSLGSPFGSSFGVALSVPGWDSIPTIAGGGPYISAVTGEYFATAGTRLLRGRVFTAAEREGSERVAIVNQTMARTLWPHDDPIGQCLTIGRGTPGCSRVVGVVSDARRYMLREDPAMQYYIPFGQEEGIGGTVLLVRPSGDPRAMMPTLRRKLLADNPSIVSIYMDVLQDRVDPQIRPWRLGVIAFGLSGLLALIVAAVGLYSVVSYLVAQRTHEIGVRMALGASATSIVTMVLRNSVGLAVFGVAVGVAIALYAGRFIGALLFDTSPRDPLVFAVVAGTLLVVAVLASLVPAARARRVDPMIALRAD